MKKLFYSLLTLGLMILVFSSCETQEDIINPKNQKHFHVTDKPLKELILNKQFNESFKKLQKNNAPLTSSENAKTALEDEYGFTITSEIAKVIEADNKTTYTFEISRENQNETYFENLVIEIDSLNQSKAILLKYTPSEEVTSDFTNQVNFKGDVAVDVIDGEENNTEGRYIFVTMITSLCTGIPYDCGGSICGFGSGIVVLYEGVEGGGGGGNSYYGGSTPMYTYTGGQNHGGSGGAGSNNTNTTGGVYGNGGTDGTGIITIPVIPKKTLKEVNIAFRASLSTAQKAWWDTHKTEADLIAQYLFENLYTLVEDGEQTHEEFAKDLIDAITFDSVVDINALNFVLKAKKGNKITNDIDENFLLSVDQFMDVDLVTNYASADPLVQYFTIQCAVIKHNHPNWSDARVIWEASKEMVHITLDALGLIPLGGEIADLTNGVLYLIEGDGVNASLSVASAIPLTGWATVSSKYAFKIIDASQTASTIANRVKLSWKVLSNGTIYFGSDNTCRKQLRKVLGLAVGNPFIAHHIMPLVLQTHQVIQKAAKSGSAFHMNEALNGIGLSTLAHNGSHSNYNALLKTKLDQFIVLNPNATPQQCYNYLINLISQIKAWILANPNTNINSIVLP